MKNVNKKLLVVTIVALILAVSCVVGTLAYLAVSTDPITNVFTAGNVKIELAETTGSSYKMVPGEDVAKDHTITVKKGSEESYVFVKVTITNNVIDENEDGAIDEVNETRTFLTITMASGWTQIAGTDVWYRNDTVDVLEADVDATIGVFAGDKVVVNDDVSQDELDYITENDTKAPKIVVTAYAVQTSADFANAEAAWDATFGV